MLKETDFKNYSFIQKEKIEELNGYGYVLEHKKTGARVLLVENDDTNKVFSIAFRTPPADDTRLLIFWNIPFYVVQISFHQKILLLNWQKDR